MEAAQEKLDKFLNRVLKRYDKFKEKSGNDHTIGRFLEGFLQQVDVEKSIILHKVYENQHVNLNYSWFYKISKAMFKEHINKLTSEEIGLYCYLCLHINLNNNMLISEYTSEKALVAKEIKELLELSNEKTKEVLKKLLNNKLIISVKQRPTNALFVNPEFAVMRSTATSFNKDYNQQQKHLKLKIPIMINHSAIRLPLFSKKDRNERISHGKRTLGIMIQITLQMNDDNEIKIGKPNDSSLLVLICAKAGIDESLKNYIQILIDNHFILVKDEVIIVNPYFAQYTRNRKFTNVTWEDIDKLRDLIY